MTGIAKPRLHVIPLIQIVLLISACVGWGVVQPKIIPSLIAGGLIGIIPQLYFALYAYRFQGARASRQVVRAFNRGESGKFLLTLMGFALAFVLIKPLDVVALFMIYIVMLVAQIVLSVSVINATHNHR